MWWCTRIVESPRDVKASRVPTTGSPSISPPCPPAPPGRGISLAEPFGFPVRTMRNPTLRRRRQRIPRLRDAASPRPARTLASSQCSAPTSTQTDGSPQDNTADGIPRGSTPRHILDRDETRGRLTKVTYPIDSWKKLVPRRTRAVRGPASALRIGPGLAGRRRKAGVATDRSPAPAYARRT